MGSGLRRVITAEIQGVPSVLRIARQSRIRTRAQPRRRLGENPGSQGQKQEDSEQRECAVGKRERDTSLWLRPAYFVPQG